MTKDETKEYQREYYQKNKLKIRERARFTSTTLNAEKISERNKINYLKKREKLLQSRKEQEEQQWSSVS